MNNGLPRRLIAELVVRWQLTKERLVVVEGAGDQRTVRLIQSEGHCEPPLASLEVWAVDAIDVPLALVRKHGLEGSGSKQRVAAFAREIEAMSSLDGFRGVVDRDLDAMLGIDVCSPTLSYTDYGCMDAYLWTPETLRRLGVLFRCEGKLGNTTAVRRLFASIGTACNDVAAVRVVAARHPGWGVVVHRSEKALAVHGQRLMLDLAKYTSQTLPAKGKLAAVLLRVREVRAEIGARDPLELMNGHDLIWLTTFALREMTSLTRRMVDEDSVARSLVVFGVMNSSVSRCPMFGSLNDWARTRPTL
jgi:hypothetical protein